MMPDPSGIAPQSRPGIIVVTGAESTGKTSLGTALAASMEAPFVPEFLRDFVTVNERLPREDDVFAIAEGFIAAREKALATGASIVVFDTDLISTVLYQRHYFGECPSSIVELSREMEGDYYLLCGDEIPWEADPGQRESQDVRAKLQVEFRTELMQRELPFAELRGSRQSRLLAAEAIVEGYFRTHGS